MNKLVVKRVIFAILIIVNCIVIFKFSSQDSEKSSETSGVVVNEVVKTVSTINKKTNKEKIKDNITFIVRKCAHFSIYTLLGVWLLNFVNTFDIETKKKILICLIFGVVYASSDEIHQIFVGGRSSEIRDVCIDSCGVLFGVFLVILFGKISNAIKKENQNIERVKEG